MSDALAANLAEQLGALPSNLAQHVMISMVALLGGVAISLPLGTLVAERPRWRYPLLTVVGVIQTVPGLALLALMVPVLVGVGSVTSALIGVEISSLGFWPAVIALTLYSMLPMVRNTVTGLLGVDAAVLDAAQAMGMTSWQRLWTVQIPLALPVILAGVRTATVWVVGVATLSTPVGQASLGNFIFAGLQTRNWVMVLVGCIAAAILAIVLDVLIGGLERAAARRSRRLAAICGGLLVVFLFGGLAAPALVAGRPGVRGGEAAASVAPTKLQRAIRIGAKTFTEQYILATLIETRLKAAAFETERVDSLGSTVIFDALAEGRLDVYVDYSGTIWANHMRRSSSTSRDAVLGEVRWWLARQHGIRLLGPLGFENAYALAMRRQQAADLGIASIGQLATHAADMRIGGDYEFFSRPEWRDVRRAYGLAFRQEITYDSTFMYTAAAEGEVDVISAFSSDGRLAAFDLVTLADPQHAIPPYDAILLLGDEAADDAALGEALRPLVSAISIDDMRQANHLVDRDTNKRSIGQAAAWLDGQLRGASKER
ncbi:MAG: ABC transporter permease/substrate-binding protein [Vicinamibacterales bacterium]